MDLIYRFVFDLVMLSGLLIIVCRMDRVQRAFIISLAIFNLILFCISAVFSNHEFSVGSGLGLFALFTMIRYRSEPIRMIEMSYLVVAVGFGILNAVSIIDISFMYIMILQVSLLAVLYFMLLQLRPEKISYKIRYEKLEFLKPENSRLLRNDIENRLGDNVISIRIESINYLDGYANLKVSFSSNGETLRNKIIAISDANQSKSSISPSRTVNFQ